MVATTGDQATVGMLHQAVAALAGVCDYAQALDDKGYNAADTNVGHALAALPAECWLPFHARQAYKILGKYAAQLERYGINYDAIPAPPPLPGERVIETDGALIAITFAYGDDLGWALKKAVGPDAVTWDKARRCYILTPSKGTHASLIAFAKQYDFVLGPGVDEVLQAGESRPSSTHLLDLEGNTFVLRFPRSNGALDAVRALPRRRWNGDKTRWEAAAGLGDPDARANAPALEKLIQTYGFTVTEAARMRLDALQTTQPAAPAAPAAKRLEVNGQRVVFVFPYDATLKDQLKHDLGARWDAAAKVWTVSVADLPKAVKWATAHGFAVAPTLAADAQRAAQEAAENKALSQAHSAEINIPGFGGPGLELFPFQRAGVAYAARAKCCIIGDEQGLGKSPMALGTLAVLNAFPALIVVPASLKLNWRKEVRRWLPNRDVTILEGTSPTPLTPGQGITIINYDILAAWLETLKNVTWGAIIADEIHYLKNPKAKRTKAAMALRKSASIRLGLSGTPIKSRPIELAMPLDFVGALEPVFGGYFKYALRYCNAHKDSLGYWQMDGASNLQELNDRLRSTVYVRREKRDVLTELPPKMYDVVPLEITNRTEYAAAERDVIQFLAKQAVEDAAFLTSIAHLPQEQQKAARFQRAQDTAVRAASAQHLVRFNTLRGLAAKGKADAVVNWASDFLESGEKLVIFAHSRALQSAIYNGLKDFQPARIHGDDDDVKRQANVDRFQTDPTCKVIVCSLEAGREGHTLTAASHNAIAQLPWTPGEKAQAEDRIHRISQEAESVTIYDLIAENTVEEDMQRILEAKRAVVSAATSGGVDGTSSESILPELVQAYLAKAQTQDGEGKDA